MLSVPGTQTLCLDLEPSEPPQDTLQEDHSLQHPQVGVVDEVACKHWSKKTFYKLILFCSILKWHVEICYVKQDIYTAYESANLESLVHEYNLLFLVDLRNIVFQSILYFELENQKFQNVSVGMSSIHSIRLKNSK